VDVKTIQSWIGILESSFIIFLLRAHHKNFNKTIVKRPKLYFIDSAIVYYLLGINNEKQIENHPLRGALFEGMVVSELLKQRTNKGLPINIYYWRDKTGREIDIIIDDGEKLIPLEIKSGMTVTTEYFKNIKYWNKLSGNQHAIVLHRGDDHQKRSNGIEVVNWKKYLTR
jgi:predicted AAA+ superfamily ATPase